MSSNTPHNSIKVFVILCLILTPISSFAASISQGLPGISGKLQTVTDTLCGPMAFVASCGGLLAAACIWKFAGHMAGMKFFSGVIAGLLIIANIVAWVNYFAGAVI